MPLGNENAGKEMFDPCGRNSIELQQYSGNFPDYYREQGLLFEERQ